MAGPDHDTKMDALLARLGECARLLTTSAGWQRWLTVASRFHRYSLNNQLLILAQRPDATRVAGYRTWQGLGRQVKRGERAIAIFAPTTRRVPREDSDEPKRVVVGFRVARVFDVTQTEGEPLPELALPEVGVPNDSLLGRLIDLAGAAGHPVRLVEATGPGVRGWFTPATGRISLVSTYSRASQTRTLLHELAHSRDPLLAQHDRAESELVAESSAYIIGTGHFGLDMDDASALYVATWSGGDTDRLYELASEVMATVRQMERLFEPETELQPLP